MKARWIVAGIIICSLTLALPKIVPEVVNLSPAIKGAILVSLCVTGIGFILKGLIVPLGMPKHDTKTLRK